MKMTQIAMERVLAWKLLPRLLMLIMAVMYCRVLNWGMSLDSLSTQQSAMISVCSGAMTGTIAVWLSHEK
jgi:Tfp pilus assembly protein PilO